MLPGRTYTPDDILAIAWHRKWVILAAVVVFTGLAAGFARRLPNLYKSETLILVIPQRIPESYVRSTVTMRMENRLRSISQEILSRTRLERVIREFNLYPELLKVKPLEQVVVDMRGDIVVETVKDDAFRITYTAREPRTAMIVTDRLASMFIDENTRDRSVMAEGTNQFLETQLDDARRRLIDHEKKLEEFRRRYSGELPSQLQTNLQVIQGSQTQIQNLQESINRDRDRRLVLEKSIADVMAAETPYTVASDPGAAQGGDRLEDLVEKARVELRALELRLTAQHPDVVAKKRQLAELERKALQDASEPERPSGNPTTGVELLRQHRAQQYQLEIDKMDRQIASKEAEVEGLRAAVVEHQRKVDAIPGHESEQVDLMRDYETLQKTYSSLLGKMEESKISANLEREQVSEQFKVLDPARLPEKPFSPNRAQITLLGAAVGLGVAFAFAAFMEYRDTSVRSEEEILRTLSLPVFAAIPRMTATSDLRRHRRLVMASMAAATVAVVALAVASLWRLGLLKGIS
jgi:polysaccharide chain length determinant protein (PEP-CTERM system associated)